MVLSKDDVIELEGKVVEVLPNAMFKVELPNGKIILAHISGKLRMNFIKILLGDMVTVEMSPYDLTRGRITWRAKNNKESQASVNENVNNQGDSLVNNLSNFNNQKEIQNNIQNDFNNQKANQMNNWDGFNNKKMK